MQPSETRKKCYRVVVASPGDVWEERDLVQSAVDEVNRTLELARRPVILTVSRWETDVYPGFHPQGPQGRVDEDLDIENCQILIGIFWKRFGTPVKDAASGTEHEIRKALHARGEKGRPDVMLYFCDRPYSLTPDEAAEIQKLLAFKKDLQRAGLYCCYESVADFERSLRRHLMQYSFKVLADTGDSRIPEESEFHFQVSTTVSSVRAEGIAELLGEITLEPRGRATDPMELPDSVNVQVFANTSLSNRLLAENLIDVCLESRPIRDRSSVHLGRIAGGNCVVFENVPLQSTREFTPQAFRILCLRGNANQLGVSSTLDPSSIEVYVQVDGIRVRDPQQIVAEIGPGLNFGILSAEGTAVRTEDTPVRLLQSHSECRHVATLRYGEGMPGAFKSRVPDPGELHGGAINHLFFESARLGSPVRVDHGAPLLTGMADCGTQLVAVFNNVPAGLRILVSPTEVHASSGLAARLLQSNSPQRLETDDSQVSFEGVRAVEVQLNMGTGMIAWEVVARDAPDPGVLDFAVFVEYRAQPDLNLPSLGTITVNGSLGPASVAGRAQVGQPIPRFADTSSARHLFKIYRQ